jgi:hypothetical protein
LRLSKVLILVGILLVLGSSVFGAENAELLPKNIGKFHQVSTTSSASRLQDAPFWNPRDASIPSQIAEYAGGNGGRAVVEIFQFHQDAQAFELLSVLAYHTEVLKNVPGLMSNSPPLTTELGTAGYITPTDVAFFKGAYVVRIRSLTHSSINLKEMAQNLSDTLDKGEGDIPALVKHLPDPENAFQNAMYLNSFTDLSRIPEQNPVFSAIQSDGNADAAFSGYGSSTVLIVEFNTPQLATDNDRRIIERIHELWKLGQRAPTAYRRVGNYSVFVFDSSNNEAAAKRLIDQVRYEQVVQWLGENPNLYKEAEKQYINTTLGVLVAVLQASGYALITCLGLGGLLGGLLFTYRRSQQKVATAYSDAGGMLRLNLDELTPETDPARLLRERN